MGWVLWGNLICFFSYWNMRICRSFTHFKRLISVTTTRLRFIAFRWSQWGSLLNSLCSECEEFVYLLGVIEYTFRFEIWINSSEDSCLLARILLMLIKDSNPPCTLQALKETNQIPLSPPNTQTIAIAFSSGIEKTIKL